MGKRFCGGNSLLGSVNGLRERIRAIVEAAMRTTGAPAPVSLEAAHDTRFGHYTTNAAFAIAKEVRKAPLEVARELAKRIRAADTQGFFEKVEAAPPGFVNFWISKGALRAEFTHIVKAGAKWGEPLGATPASVKTTAGRQDKPGTVIIDYSAPNIAKPMSVGHLRSTIIGATLYNIFKFSGWKTIGDNHLGDWGRQFGILIAAFKEGLGIRGKGLGSGTTIQNLMSLYVDYNARMKDDAALQERARMETKKLQDGDPENTKLWKQFYKISLAEFKKIYTFLGVKFDYSYGESHYKDMLPDIVKDALQKGVAVRSEGAVIILVPGKAPLVIQKSDEAFLYATTDIATVKQRVKQWKPNLILYVVGSEQALHLEQLFYAVKQLGIVPPPHQRNDEKLFHVKQPDLDTKVNSAKKEHWCGGERETLLVHVRFGMILGEDMKKLSTRAGKHIALEEVIQEAIERARKIVDEKRPDLAERERAKIARAIGIAALKYNDLSQNRQSDIAFQWDKMLNLEGNSAPYLMYSYARLKSILRKAGRVPKLKNVDALTRPSESQLILKLANFPDVIEEVTRNYFPHYLADYLYDLAKEANAFYEQEPVLKAAPDVRAARLALIGAAAQTLKTGLGLLGIGVVERM